MFTCGQQWWPGRIGERMMSWIIFFTNAGSLHKIFSRPPKWKVKVWHKIWLRGGRQFYRWPRKNRFKQAAFCWCIVIWEENLKWYCSKANPQMTYQSHQRVLVKTVLSPDLQSRDLWGMSLEICSFYKFPRGFLNTLESRTTALEQWSLDLLFFACLF